MAGHRYRFKDFLDRLEGTAWRLDDEIGELGDDETIADLRLTVPQFMALCGEVAESIDSLDCVWCGVNTADVGEYYMVHDELWEKYGPPKRGCLCIGCLELRIGRRLRPDDFMDAPANWMGSKSERLRQRLIQPSLFDANQQEAAG